MDRSAIKNFAVESRRQMIESVKYQASLIGITAEGINNPISKAEGMETYDYGAGTHTIFDEDIKKRKSLLKEIENNGFENVVEEVAYTWFNRIIAIRFMEVNDYLPTRTRVLSSEIEDKIEPDLINEALDLDLNYASEDIELIIKLKDENKLDDLFQFLFIKQCNNLNDILPGLFIKTNDYMELLLNISFTNEEGIIRRLIKEIPETDFRESVEIIGWLYQYYMSEKKDVVNSTLKSKPINKNDIPAATQLFTPNWIVKYMVDNSLGRYWIEKNHNSNLKNKLTYYFDENVKNNYSNVNLEDLKFFDPCMGSAHILVYAFDLFMEMYKELGYIERDIPELIIQNNIYGLDIDKRAYQFAYFAIMMKGRQYNRRFFNINIAPNVYPIVDGNISQSTLDYIKSHDVELYDFVCYLNDVFENAAELGSLIKIKKMDYDYYNKKLDSLLNTKNQKISDYNVLEELENNLISMFNQFKLLSMKYEVVVTNPPYLNKFDKSLKDFSKKYYKDYSRDLFAMFMYRNFDFCTEDGYLGFMTPLVWMYIKSFEKLREFIIHNKSIVSLVEMEYNTLWEIEAHVPACTFVLSNKYYGLDYESVFLKLSEFTGGLNVQKEKTLNAINNSVDYKYVKKSSDFLKIPGSPIACWVNDDVINIFENNFKLKEKYDAKQGLASGDNKRFLRRWFEVNYNDIGFGYHSNDEFFDSGKKFAPHNKGGFYRKWYGNQEFIIKFDKYNFDILASMGNHLPSRNLYFNESLSWSEVSMGAVAFRFFPEGFVFDSTGSSAFIKDENIYYLLGFFNSSVCQFILDLISPTLHYTVGAISLLPIIIDDSLLEPITKLSKQNILISKEDWDDYEISWGFSKHPLLKFNESNLAIAFEKWESYKEDQFNLMKSNELSLNNYFSKIYDIDVDLNIKDELVSVNLANYESDIKSFISYSVGCMFGRYSLDDEGIQFAGGTFNLDNYCKFEPDDDNIIPVLDTEYFEDDIVGKFIEFVKICFGEENLEENLDFIASALNKKGKTSREIIRNYFLTDFFKDHTQIYKKSPIYWQFDSGKQNAFKCLVYMHRYESDIIARIRADYLHKTQKAIEQNMVHCDKIIATSSNKSEISKATKDKTRFIKQLEEIRVYDEVLGHMANENIEIDLEDGVKINYDKFQKVEISKEGEKTKKINLLKNI